MERRKAIKNLGLSFGAMVATPAAVSLLESCSGPTTETWIPTYYSNAQGVMLRKVIDRILPAVDDLPSATEVNVHVFIDKFMAEVMALDQREQMTVAFDTCSAALLEKADTDDHERVTDEVIDAFLSENLALSKEDKEAIDGRIGAAFGQGLQMADLETELQVHLALDALRGISIWAYRTNEFVGKNVLAYDPVPGENIGCGDLQELTGGRDWSEGTYLVL